MSLLSLAALVTVSCGVVFAGDWEFDHVVKEIEAHYGTSRTHIPLMGVANFFVKVTRPSGTNGFKLAVFEDLKSTGDSRESSERDRFMDRLSGSRMHPIVRVRSRRDGESTYIYANDFGKSTKLLLVCFERNEATVVQVKMNTDELLKSLGEPEHLRDTVTGKSDR
ncbi:MAG: hypothetical protein U0Q18_10490 [Bryobacteraceae bacterium]